MPKRVTADWVAQQWRDGKRTKKKIGDRRSGVSCCVHVAWSCQAHLEIVGN
jgi:hypothetical protein